MPMRAQRSNAFEWSFSLWQAMDNLGGSSRNAPVTPFGEHSTARFRIRFQGDEEAELFFSYREDVLCFFEDEA